MKKTLQGVCQSNTTAQLHDPRALIKLDQPVGNIFLLKYANDWLPHAPHLSCGIRHVAAAQGWDSCSLKKEEPSCMPRAALSSRSGRQHSARWPSQHVSLGMLQFVNLKRGWV